MTTIIWRKLKDWTLQIAWDKRTTFVSWIVKDLYTKVLNLDWTLVWKYWDTISYEFFKELYERWKVSVEWMELKLETISDAVHFYNFVKANSNMKNDKWEHDASIWLMFLNHNFQIHIEPNLQVNELASNWVLFWWSWSNILQTFDTIVAMPKFKYDVDFEDYYEVVSTLDPYTSREYDVLTLLPDINIESN